MPRRATLTGVRRTALLVFAVGLVACGTPAVTGDSVPTPVTPVATESAPITGAMPAGPAATVPDDPRPPEPVVFERFPADDVVYDFRVPDGGLTLPDRPYGFVYDAQLPITPERVAEIAAALGVTGEVVAHDGGWRVGPLERPTLVVLGADHRWVYDAMPDEVAQVPERVPSEDEARELALALLAAMGVTTDGLELTAGGDEWWTVVDATEYLDGTVGGAILRHWSFQFGGGGELGFATGLDATVAPVGPYPLAGLDEALARLEDGLFVLGHGRADEAAEQPVEAAASASVPPPGVPLPVDVVRVEADLSYWSDPAGSVWLTPAYRFVDAHNRYFVVPAVADELLVIADVPPPAPAAPPPTTTLPALLGGPGTVPLR